MKRKTIIILLSCAFVLCATLTGCKAGNSEKKDDKPTEDLTVTNIKVKSSVTSDGGAIECIEYHFNQNPDVNLKKEDFQITQDDKDYAVTEIETKENTIIVRTDSILLEQATVPAQLKVDCTNDMFDADASKLQDIQIKTVDEFVHHTYTDENNTELSYWLYAPEGSKNLPLMVWLHGGGEVLASSYEGANLISSKGAVTWIEHGKETAVLSVQFPENYSFGITEKEEEYQQMKAYNTAQYELIQTLIADGTVDANRVYICGASSGGGGALSFLMQYPDLFAAAVPIAAKDTVIPLSEPYGLSYNFEDVTISDEEYDKCVELMRPILQIDGIENIPIWFVQTENDPICTSYTSKIMYQILSEMGAQNNHITLYSDEDMGNEIIKYHFSWVPALDNEEIIDWVYAQERSDS